MPTLVFRKDYENRKAGRTVPPDWLRAQVDAMGIGLQPPDLVRVREVVARHLPAEARVLPKHFPNPDASSDWLQHLLGIAAIVRLNGETLAWGATTDPEEAQVLVEGFAQGPYSAIRRELGIDYQWIWLFHPDLLASRSDIAQCCIAEQSEHPHDRHECVLVRC